MAADGGLVLVVGPSGAGKDSLIGAARAALADDARFVFPRRVVTRHAQAELEDHDSIEGAEFEQQRLGGAYALSWQAHGLSYGVPVSIDAAVAAGRVVVVNGSRKVITEAVSKYARCLVVLVTAPAEIRAVRLRARGRETDQEIAARLAREGAVVPPGIGAVSIDNSGPVQDGAGRLVAALRNFARD